MSLRISSRPWVRRPWTWLVDSSLLLSKLSLDARKSSSQTSATELNTRHNSWIKFWYLYHLDSLELSGVRKKNFFFSFGWIDVRSMKWLDGESGWIGKACFNWRGVKVVGENNSIKVLSNKPHDNQVSTTILVLLNIYYFKLNFVSDFNRIK